MKSSHAVTLPKIQANIFAEILRFCAGVTPIMAWDDTEENCQIITVMDKKDREAAWELFREKFSSIIS